MRSCDVEGCFVTKSLTIDCTLIDSGVSESKRGGCEVLSGAVMENVVEAKMFFSLRIFPVEIRKMIYSHVIASEGVTTGLIAALRKDALLYGEILETLFRDHSFVLGRENLGEWRITSEAVLRRITKILLQ
jgi:hypothetical protein